MAILNHPQTHQVTACIKTILDWYKKYKKRSKYKPWNTKYYSSKWCPKNIENLLMANSLLDNLDWCDRKYWLRLPLFKFCIGFTARFIGIFINQPASSQFGLVGIFVNRIERLIPSVEASLINCDRHDQHSDPPSVALHSKIMMRGNQMLQRRGFTRVIFETD